jgi:adenine/guanine phosphoribosyltransferase-like PRPP-binding protein
MSEILIIDFSFTPQQIFYLRKFGVSEIQALSWMPENRNSEKIVDVLRSVRVKIGLKFKIIEKQVNIIDESSDLETVFTYFIHNGISQYLREIGSNCLEHKAIVLNFFPFSITKTIVDKLSLGLKKALKTLSRNLAKVPIVVLTRNSNSFIESEIFSDIINNKEITNRVIVIDNYREFLNCENSKIKKERKLPKDILRGLLKSKEKDIYNTLIYHTNSYIGHFDLNSSHVRTHYDLYDFVANDMIIEYLIDSIEEVTNGFKKILVFDIGLEHASTRTLATKFAMKSKRNRIFEPISGRQFEEYKFKEKLRDFDCILIITDIVNSGSTLRNLVGQIEKFNKNSCIIKIFSIAIMKNTEIELTAKHKINTKIVIQREYYPPKKDKCILCQLKQPITKVEQSDQFKKIQNIQLTPLDFWEIVKDSKALRINEKDAQNRKFLFRIDTIRIIDKYKKWLKNVIDYKYKNEWHSVLPNLIFTVKENEGINFSMLVADSIGIDPDKILPIDRDILKKIAPNSNVKEILKIPDNLNRILLVDDGINSGSTIRSLIEVCRAINIAPIGAITLDSRLSHSNVEGIEHHMSGKIISLYDWRSSTKDVL